MRKPQKRNSQISEERIAEWLERFSVFRRVPKRVDIENWLSRFNLSKTDKDLAARLLDCVELISEDEILQGYKAILDSLSGWSKSKARRKGRWFFVGFGRGGDSGGHMLRLFREANGLASSRHDDLFRHVSELAQLGLGITDTVVFVDDFAGSGEQACKFWPTVKELVAGDAKVYLVLTACTQRALNRIRQETDAHPVTFKKLIDADNYFSSRCTAFTGGEKATILRYCQVADRKNPKGFGECGLLFVLAHKTPNNSLPVLHAKNKKWQGLFPRHLIPA